MQNIVIKSARLKCGCFFIIVFLFFRVASGQAWVLPRDAHGWSVVTPSADSRLVYVSSSDGNDSTARNYVLAEAGNDARTPGVAIKAYKSINAGMNQMRDGYPDWLLLRRGDIWNKEGLSLHDRGSGRGPKERHVVTYYGASGERPMLKNGASLAIGNRKNNYWAIIGLCFYDSKADPKSVEYDASLISTGSVTFLSGGTDILFEDCRFRFTELVIQGAGARFQNIEIRRNILTDQYYDSSCINNRQRPSAAYIDSVQNYLIEENMVDYCGWNKDLLPTADRNMYNHGWYLQYTNRGDLYFRGNIMSRCAANGVQNRAGGKVECNLSIQNPIGISVNHDTTHGPGATPGLTCARNNVIIEGIYMGDCKPVSSGANWGLDLGSLLESTTAVQDNIIAHNIDPRGSVVAINKTAPCVTTGNIVYDWHKSEDMVDPKWPAPNRSVGSYNASIGGVGTTGAFIESARNRGLHEWPPELSASAVIDYIREGFGLGKTAYLKNRQIRNPSGFMPFESHGILSHSKAAIRYRLPQTGRVRITIYSLRGEEIATIIDDVQGAGDHSIEWKGKNAAGIQTGSGLYLYSIRKTARKW